MRVLNFGTFDNGNYGDSLYPLLAQKRVGESLGAELIPVAPVGGRSIWEDALPSININEISELNPFRGIIIGGGSIIYPHTSSDKYYSRVPFFAYPDLWLGVTSITPTGCPICWNAPGVPGRFEDEFKEEIEKCLKRADYVSVCDDLSRDYLYNVFSEKNIEVVPDPVWEVNKLWSLENLFTTKKNIFSRLGLKTPDRTLAVHLDASHLCGFSLADLARIIDDLAEKLAATPIFVSMSPAHGDIGLAEQVGAAMKSEPLVLKEAKRVKEVAACLATSVFYVGSSLHGFITASAYGVPGVCVTDGSKGEHSQLQSLFYPLDIHFFSWKSVLNNTTKRGLERLKIKAQKIHKESCLKVDRHWDIIFEKFRNSNSQKLENDFQENLYEYRIEVLRKKTIIKEKKIKKLNYEFEYFKKTYKEMNSEIDRIKNSKFWFVYCKYQNIKQKFPNGIRRLNNIINRFGCKGFFKHDNIEIMAPSLSEIDQYKLRHNNSNIAVFTCITSGYDKLIVPEKLNSSVDYICFSDTPLDGYGVWQIRPIPYYHPDPVRMARFIKTHPHLLLKDYDLAIWIDANIVIRCDFHTYIKDFLVSCADTGFIIHPVRECIYEEAEACVQFEKDDPSVIQSQVEYYKELGIPRKLGMYETNLFIVKLRNHPTKLFFRQWWNEIKKFSRRDQLGVVPALRNNSLAVLPLMKNGQCLRNVDDFLLIPHGQMPKIKFPDYLATSSKVKSPYDNESFFSVKDIRLQEAKKKSVDIIVCVYNALEDVKKCFESVERYREENHRIIVVNDFSNCDTTNYLKSFSEGRPYVTLIQNENNLGYTKSANIGLKKSISDLSIVLNSDTIVTRDWATKLVDLAYSSPTIGIVGPLSNAASYQSIPEIKNSRKNTAINTIPSSLSPEDINTACEKWAINDCPAIVPLAHGFCFGIRRDTIEKIGYFDEVNFERYYGEENDYCFRASLAGFDLAIATNTYIFHKKSMSISEEERLIFMKKAGIRLRELYGADRVKQACLQMEGHHLLIRIRQSCQELYSFSGYN